MMDAPERGPGPSRKRSTKHQRRLDLADVLQRHHIKLIITHGTRLQLLALLSVITHSAADKDGVSTDMIIARARARLRRIITIK